MPTPGRTLYVRGVPDELLREAKACAARRGTTLTAVVVEALRQSLPREAPRPAVPSIQEDVDWYEAHKERLLTRYRGEYLAIVDREVVDHGREFSPLAGRVFRRFGNRSVFMPRCTPEERVVRLRSPRRAAS